MALKGLRKECKKQQIYMKDVDKKLIRNDHHLG